MQQEKTIIGFDAKRIVRNGTGLGATVVHSSTICSAITTADPVSVCMHLTRDAMICETRLPTILISNLSIPKA